MAPCYGQANGMYDDPAIVTPWVFGAFRATHLDGVLMNSDSDIYPANYRPLNKYIDPTAMCEASDQADRGRDIIPLFKCPADRYNRTNIIGGEGLFTEEETWPAYEANGSSYSLNTRWLQGYFGRDFTPEVFYPPTCDEGFARIAKTAVGGGASRFIQWVEFGFYSAAQNAAERIEWGQAPPQRYGWHRRFSYWSVCFADGHVAHGYFDTRQVYGLDGSIWAPGFYLGSNLDR